MLIERGAERYLSKDFDGATTDLRKAIRWFPEHPGGHFNLASVEAARSRWRQADDLLSIAIPLNPLDARAWHNRGVARWKLGRLSQGLSDLDEALRLDPEHSSARDLAHRIRRILAESE